MHFKMYALSTTELLKSDLVIARSRLHAFNHACSEPKGLHKRCRNGAAACLQRLSARVKDAETVASMSGALEAVLSSKAEGKLRNATERLGVLKGLTALSSSPCRGQAMGKLAANLAFLLAKMYK